MDIFGRMGYPGPVGFAVAVLSAGLAGMVGLGSYGHFRQTKKKWSPWKAGFAAGAVAMGVGAAAQLATSYIAGGTSTSGVTMRRIGLISAQQTGLLTAKKVGAVPTIVAGLTAERLQGGCSGCGW